MKNINIKKWLGTLLMTIGVVGFFINANQKNDQRIFDARISNNDLKNLSIDIEANHMYMIKFWGVDEEMTNTYSQPSFAANIKVLNSEQTVLFSEELISITQKEVGGKLVTHDGISYLHECTTNESLQMMVQITDGDYMDVEVYKDLSSEDDAMPGFFIIIAIVGVVLYFRRRKQ